MPKETSQIAVVMGFKQNKWGYSANIRYEAIRHFRNKKREYLKDKISELATNSKNKSIKNM
jgi:hypothetical protein